MRIQRIENERPTPKAPVTVKVCGNVIEVRHSEQGAPEITIEKLSADEYLDKRTGEIKEFQHTENRAENTASVAQTPSQPQRPHKCQSDGPGAGIMGHTDLPGNND